MAKRDAPKTDNSRGKSKATGRAGTRTAANKQRGAATRLHRLMRASNRRASKDYIVPMNATIEARNPDTQQIEIAPDPKRGKKLNRSKRLSDVLARREEQAARIEKKQAQRDNFRKLSPAEKDRRRIFRTAT